VRWKAAAVVETLARIAGLQPPEDLRVIAGDAWAWRLRTQLHVEPEGGSGGRPAVGYFERASHDLVAVDRCPILVPELERLVPRLPALLARAASRPGDGSGDGPGGGAGRPATGEAETPMPRRLDLAAGDGGVVTTAPRVEGLPHGEVAVAVGPYTYRFDARCFFQSHRGLLPELVDAVLGPDEETGESAFDLYCGVGLFTLPLAARYRRVVGVEGERLAVRYARRNAKRNGCDGVEIEGRAVESWIGLLPEGADRVVVDPPRTGLKGRVLEVLQHRAPNRITYVSCHPAALARDLKTLKQHYDIESLTLIDLFPQT
jgi:23S rRNA (uracil1939-C5)-methyltransferase